MFRFFESVPRVRVGDHERKGDTLMEVNLGITKTDGFGFGQTKAVEHFYSLLLQAGINTSVDAGRRSYLSCFSHVPSTPVVVLMKEDSR